MSHYCKICLAPVDSDEDYHGSCVRGLFPTARVPRLDLAVGRLHTAALAMVGHTSLSGIQKKISVRLSTDRETLQVAAEGGRYILKPQTETYPALPENEHLTTRLAQLVGIDVPAFGLISLTDNSLAYITRRFDRLDNGRKLRQEDFCQLAEKSPKEKYDGSSELCVRLLRKFADEPTIEVLKLYRIMLFGWWSGNGDMHLKNLSLFHDERNVARLTPAYDLVCTRLVIPNDPLALSASGKKDNLDRRDWLKFAEYCQLPFKAAQRVLDTQAQVLDDASAIIDRSFLSSDLKTSYAKLIMDRSTSLL
jgi:serine/threonine-protein kinase HipA